MEKKLMKVAIIPGNGGGAVETSVWYTSVRDLLCRDHRVSDILLRDMPDPYLARENFWLPFMHDELVCDENTIIIGHSSGAVAAMRYAERWPIAGLVLVGAYCSDLDDETEKLSGYFSRPWQWERIRQNAPFIVQFGSTDDPFLPWPEQKVVADALEADMRQFTDRGHFTDAELPEIVEAIQKLLDNHRPE